MKELRKDGCRKLLGIGVRLLCHLQVFSDMLINALVLIECKDERNCEWIVKQAEIYGRHVADYCEAYKDTAPVKQCRQTCGMCEL